MNLLQEMISINSYQHTILIETMLNESFQDIMFEFEQQERSSPNTFIPQTNDINKAIDWLLAARKAMGYLSSADVKSKLPPEVIKKHLSRFFSNFNRIKGLVNRLSKQHSQEYPTHNDANNAMISH